MNPKHRMMFHEGDGAPTGNPSQAPAGGSLLGDNPSPPAPSDPKAVDYAALVNPDGSFKENWMDNLGDEWNDSKGAIGAFKTLPELFKGYAHTKSMVGKKGLIVPGEGATPEQIAEFRKGLGVPDKPEDYSLKPEKLPDGFEWSDAKGAEYAKLAHQHNIPPTAMKALIEQNLKDRAEEVASFNAGMEQREREAVDGLKKEWGSNFDANRSLAGKTAKYLGYDPQSPLFGNPEVVKIMAKVGGIISEDKTIGSNFTAQTNPGPVEAHAIINDKNHPLHERWARGDREAVARVTQLMKS